MKKQNLAMNFLLLLLLIVGAATSATAQRKPPVGNPDDKKLLIPNLEWKSYDAKSEKAANGKMVNTITLGITNWDTFSQFFAPAPDLPPCGSNKNSSRTWYDVFDLQTNAFYWSNCGATKAEDVKAFTISIPNENLPTCVYVVLHDRKTGKKYKSNAVRTDGSKEKCEIKKP